MASTTRARRLTATILSLVQPGLGHMILGRWPRAGRWLAVMLLTYPLLIGAILFGSATSLWSMAGVVVALLLACTFDAARVDAGEPLPATGKVVAAWLGIGVCFFAIATTVKQFVVESFVTASGSMAPTLQPGDLFVVDKRPFTPQRGDVVVYESGTDAIGRPLRLVKRVVAIGGDRVELRGAELRINDTAVTQGPTETCNGRVERAGDRTYRVCYDGDVAGSFPLALVPAGTVFVLGDNRDDSHDSRHIGAIPLQRVIGRAKFIYLGGPGVRRARLGLKLD